MVILGTIVSRWFVIFGLWAGSLVILSETRFLGKR